MRVLFAGVINNTKPLFIGDLFSGPGQDANGSAGSPKVLLDYIAGCYFDGLELEILFNEMNTEFANSLNSMISSHDITKKKWVKCTVLNRNYDTLVQQIIDAQKQRERPKYFKRFFFIDPFGYKGTRLNDMLESLLLRQIKLAIMI